MSHYGCRAEKMEAMVSEELNWVLLIDELRNLPTETEWVEFKHDNKDPDMIAKRLSALANSATLRDIPHAYLVWGIDDSSHEVLGTTFNPRKAKKGGEEIENWLHHVLSENASFRFFSVEYEDKKVVLAQVEPARGHTVDYQSTAYIRVGFITKKLKDYPSMESEVWNHISRTHFENDSARGGLKSEEALSLLDYSKYFSLLGVPMPQSHSEILHALGEDDIVRRQEDGQYSITNLGALLLANDLGAFPTVSRKALRIIQYEGSRKTQMLRERQSKSGYAVDYEAAIEFIMTLVPSSEPIVSGLRRKEVQYPEIAIREILANALIHQDLSITGSGPMVELFDNRIDFSNPGVSLVETLRLVDNPPKSRNQQLAALMRRFHICEEAGSGWDKIISACEEFALPAPSVSAYSNNEGSMRVSLFPYTSFSMLGPRERTMVCYWHSCMCYLDSHAMSNSSLRARFGKEAPSASTISRVIRDAVEDGLIKPVDPEASQKYMRYIPSWA